MQLKWPKYQKMKLWDELNIYICFGRNGTKFRPKLKKYFSRCRSLWKVDGWRKFLQPILFVLVQMGPNLDQKSLEN